MKLKFERDFDYSNQIFGDSPSSPFLIEIYQDLLRIYVKPLDSPVEIPLVERFRSIRVQDGVVAALISPNELLLNDQVIQRDQVILGVELYDSQLLIITQTGVEYLGKRWIKAKISWYRYFPEFSILCIYTNSIKVYHLPSRSLLCSLDVPVTQRQLHCVLLYKKTFIIIQQRDLLSLYNVHGQKVSSLKIFAEDVALSVLDNLLLVQHLNTWKTLLFDIYSSMCLNSLQLFQLEPKFFYPNFVFVGTSLYQLDFTDNFHYSIHLPAFDTFKCIARRSDKTGLVQLCQDAINRKEYMLKWFQVLKHASITLTAPPFITQDKTYSINTILQYLKVFDSAPLDIYLLLVQLLGDKPHQLRHFIHYKIIPDSIDIAKTLKDSTMAFEMYKRLGRNHDAIRILISNNKLLQALDFAIETDSILTFPSEDFLEASLSDPLTFLNTFRCLEQHGAFHGSPTSCNSFRYVSMYREMWGPTIHMDSL